MYQERKKERQFNFWRIIMGGRPKGKHLVQLWITEEKYNEVKLAAESVEEPVTTWIRRAIFTALRRWEKPQVAKSAYPKCSVCGKHHNEQDHFNQSENS